jgi:hypothetical protein
MNMPNNGWIVPETRNIPGEHGTDTRNGYTGAIIVPPGNWKHFWNRDSIMVKTDEIPQYWCSTSCSRSVPVPLLPLGGHIVGEIVNGTTGVIPEFDVACSSGVGATPHPLSLYNNDERIDV